MRNLLLVSLMVLAGCVSMGKEISQEQLTEFKKGVTTEKDVIAKLGSPTTSSMTASGQRSLGYMFAHAQARPESFIPFIGPFVGGADSRGTTVIFLFGPDGTLTDYYATQTQLGMGVGIEGGTYQEPYRDQPQEAPVHTQ